MKSSVLVQGDYIAADEFGEREPTWTIATAKLVKMEDEKSGREKNKGVIFFQEIARGWVVNRTNVLLLNALFGTDETNEWIGRKVTLHAQLVPFGSEKKNGIRVKGSPDLDRSVTVTVKLPRRKAQHVTLVPTAKGRAPQSQSQDIGQQEREPGTDDA